MIIIKKRAETFFFLISEVSIHRSEHRADSKLALNAIVVLENNATITLRLPRVAVKTGPYGHAALF